MQNIEISIKYIKAVSFAMAKKDIRYYLNGMLFEHNGAETRLVATDGSRLHIGRIDHNEPCAIMESFIMPSDMVEKILKVKTPKGSEPFVSISTDGYKITVKTSDNSIFEGIAVEGTYPEYQRVIPEELSGEPAQLNPDYVKDAQEGVRLWGGYSKFHMAHVHQNGNAASCITDVQNKHYFLAVIMPLKEDKNLPFTSWAKSFLPSLSIEKLDD